MFGKRPTEASVGRMRGKCPSKRPAAVGGRRTRRLMFELYADKRRGKRFSPDDSWWVGVARDRSGSWAWRSGAIWSYVELAKTSSGAIRREG